MVDHGPKDRRDFLRDTLGRAARVAKRQAEKRVLTDRWLRPPGALEEVAFLAACTRCGDCVSVCPVHAIQHAPTRAGLAAGTPMINVAIQACVACEEMPCAAICPTEALNVPDGVWDHYRLGTLELDSDRCITFHGSECRRCVSVCPVGETAISSDETGKPVIKFEGCVGCGRCVTACVTNPSSLRLHF